MAKAPSVSVLSREKSGENGPGRSLFCPLQHDLIMANIDINFQVGDRRPPSPTLSTQNKPVDEAGKQKDTLVLPVELRREIIHAALQLDDPYDLERFIHDRGSCRLIDKDTDAFITHTPSFWSHILISPRVNFESLTTSLPETFSLTIRLDVQDPDWWTLDNELWKYVRRIITTFGPRMRRCYALSLQGPSHYLIGGLLQDLDASSADLLHSLTVKFDLLHHCYAGQIHSEDENGWLGTTPPHIYNFGFSQFGPAFHPFTTISIISTSHGACPSVTYSSAPQPTLLLSQPAGCPLDWGQTMNMLSSARSMTKLVLVGVHFEQYTSHEIMVVPPPLVALETLHLDFAGSESMACSLSRLVAPYVKTLKLVFSRGYQDLACACMCPHILSTISHLTLLVGIFSEPSKRHPPERALTAPPIGMPVLCSSTYLSPKPRTRRGRHSWPPQSTSVDRSLPVELAKTRWLLRLGLDGHVNECRSLVAGLVRQGHALDGGDSIDRRRRRSRSRPSNTFDPGADPCRLQVAQHESQPLAELQSHSHRSPQVLSSSVRSLIGSTNLRLELATLASFDLPSPSVNRPARVFNRLSIDEIYSTALRVRRELREIARGRPKLPPATNQADARIFSFVRLVIISTFSSSSSAPGRQLRLDDDLTALRVRPELREIARGRPKLPPATNQADARIFSFVRLVIISTFSSSSSAPGRQLRLDDDLTALRLRPELREIARGKFFYDPILALFDHLPI
ncbi:hypothetical protein FB451DRAFT_1187794 [Mycena latifolia]|nr:hypothetical protein FB451DRAFT_1187794 [Mycena latifolia]